VFDKWFIKLEIVICIFVFLASPVRGESSKLRVQEDTVRTPDVETVPVIDGQGDDACWTGANWQTIDQVWIPYGGSVGSDDYTGQYKIVWSSAENVLYFLVQVNDDAFIDGYEYPGGGYYNYDIVEVFIDEDKSGGPHIFDGAGSNAENAFSYHVVVDAPEDGEINSDFVVCDLGGYYEIRNYAGHFPQLAMRKDGNQYTWEFSLAVYDDTYDHSDPEASRVTLTEDKIIGLSLAYCDNDADDGDRDNFFGSVWVPAEEFNSHWENADGYGTIKLIGEGSGIEDDPINPGISFTNYPNLFADKTIIEFNLTESSEVKIDVLNLLGQPVDTVVKAKFGRGSHTLQWSAEDMPCGIYFFRMQTTTFKDIKKILIIK
jgi:hypothetical protein